MDENPLNAFFSDLSQTEVQEGQQDFKEPLTFDQIKEKTDKYVLNTYNRHPVSFFFGQGESLHDTEHREYIDFLCGIAVTSLGHGEADLVEAIRDQAERLMHTSNLFYNEEQANLAEALIAYSFPGKVFFCNSGTEANEAAFKLARSYGQQARDGAHGIISLNGSFHGRSTAAMCMTSQEKIHGGFGPLVPGMKYIDANDIDVLETELTQNGKETCAVIMELVQGEGGVRPLDREYVHAARQLTQEHRVLLIVDEVQTGIGRTGKLFAFEHYGIEPDAVTLAKALGGGFPIGAMIVRDAAAKYLGPGQHGSTYGGNHLAARVAFETLKIIIGREVLNNVAGISEYMFRRLRTLQAELPAITDVRGLGLHIGVEMDRECKELAGMCLENGLLVNCAADTTIRIMPPLNISLEKASEGLDIFEEQVRAFAAKAKA